LVGGSRRGCHRGVWRASSTSKFALTQLVDKADRWTAWEFLEHLLKAAPYRIHTILTDNGSQFTEQPRNRNTVWSRQMRFDMICKANGIEHRLTKPNHPSTNGQVERMTSPSRKRPSKASNTRATNSYGRTLST
jgi:transposase InsO family protein